MAFHYRNGILSIDTTGDAKPLTDWTLQRDLPFYIYSRHSVVERLKWYRDCFTLPIRVRFALKANAFLPLLQELAGLQAGGDVVSGPEIDRALEAGMATGDLVFSGVGKSKQELQQATDLKIGQINVESLEELSRLKDVARERKGKISVALRLNPDVRVETHPYIATGQFINKFGIDRRQLPEALAILKSASENLNFSGLAIHLGSQILDIEPILRAVRWLKATFVELQAEGWKLQSLDIGGGLGIDYDTADETADQARVRRYGAEISRLLGDLKAEVLVEPGRFLVARSGALLTQVEYVKQSIDRCFVIVNSGMNHLLRPALYHAEHRILTVEERPAQPEVLCDIVGPICESSDVFGRERRLRQPQAGDWLAILDTGAYGYSMASQYNLRALPEQILC